MVDRRLHALALALFVTAAACGKKEADAGESKDKAKTEDSEKPKKKKKPALDLSKVTDDELKAAVAAEGYNDPFVFRPELKSSDHSEVSVSVDEPKMQAVIYNFAAGVQSAGRVAHKFDINDKRVLGIDAMDNQWGGDKIVGDTLDILSKADCSAPEPCGKALTAAGYSELSGADSSTQLGPLSYSYINAKKGTKYVQTKLYRYKHDKFDVVSRVDGKIVVAAFPDGDKAVSKDKLQKFLDAVK